MSVKVYLPPNGGQVWIEYAPDTPNAISKGLATCKRVKGIEYELDLNSFRRVGDLVRVNVRPRESALQDVTLTVTLTVKHLSAEFLRDKITEYGTPERAIEAIIDSEYENYEQSRDE